MDDAVKADSGRTAVGSRTARRETLATKLRWLLIAVTMLTYWSVSQHPFIHYDDPAFVSQNPHVYTGLTPSNLKWAFTTLNGDATSYQPLAWLTHQLDCQLWGLNAGVHHLTNLWFHVANTLLLFTLFHKLTAKPWRCATVAALFALHPLHVETVAWISERKSLVCAFFWLLATLAYIRYARRPGVRLYLPVFLLYAAALLSKPIAVSLPFTLLLLDFWPLRRWGPGIHVSHKQIELYEQKKTEGTEAKNSVFSVSSCKKCHYLFVSHYTRKLSSGVALLRAAWGPLVVEKLPMFLLSGLACWVTVLAQADLGATRSIGEVPMVVRLSNSVVACALYLRKVVWPVDLAPIYPLRHDWVWWQVAGAALLLVAISVWAIRRAGQRPWLLVGWCWYLVTLFPTLGLVQVGAQGMADRYTYVPLVGVFLFLVWEVSERLAGHAKAILAAGAVAATTACTALTLSVVSCWQSSVRLFEHAVKVTKDNFIACSQLGVAYGNEGRYREAESQYRQSLSINSNYVISQLWLANLLVRQGDYRGALELYSLALKLRPADAGVHWKMAGFLLGAPDLGVRNRAKALEHARLACELSHYRKRALVALLAEAYAENGQFEEASEAARKALALSVGPQETQDAMELAARIRQRKIDGNEKTGAAGVSASR